MASRAVLLGSLIALALCASCAKCDTGPAPSDPSVHPGPARATRTADTIRREGNHLRDSVSQYLREHAHDPVDWYPWGEEALAAAVASDKPIFLSIGYSACHYCHVMHDEVFAKDDVAALLNERFIAIKVDREERPDLDSTYMAALSRFTQSPGWPATLFLTPGKDPFFGATYMQHARFLETASRAATLWKEHEAGALSVLPITDVLGDGVLAKGTSLTVDELKAFATAATEDMDLARGGSKGSAKFPMPPRLSFLLHATRRWDLPELASALRVTLGAIAKGALRDPISYGFHRYTTDPAWAVPHYEIMLYDVAQLATLFFEAAVALSEPAYTDIGNETLAFLEEDMRVRENGFAASFDADTGGEEGAAWRWSSTELADILGPDSVPVAALLGVGAAKVAPSRWKSIAAVARETGRPEQEVTKIWARARPRLRSARARLLRRDDKIVASWNGLAIVAFCTGFEATANARYRDTAVAVGDALWASHHEKRGTLTRTAGGNDAYAADYGDLAAGYLALFSATSAEKWLTRADELFSESKALEAPDGGYYEGRSDLAKTIKTDDGVEPSGTAALLRALLSRQTLGANDATSALLARAFERYGNTLRAVKLGAAAWLDVALLDAGPDYQVVLAGAAPDAAPLSAAYGQTLPPWATLLRVPGDGAPASLTALLPTLAGKTKGRTATKAFICDRTICLGPTSDPAVFKAQLLRGWHH